MKPGGRPFTELNIDNQQNTSPLHGASRPRQSHVVFFLSLPFPPRSVLYKFTNLTLSHHSPHLHTLTTFLFLTCCNAYDFTTHQSS